VILNIRAELRLAKHVLHERHGTHLFFFDSHCLLTEFNCVIRILGYGF